MPTHNSCTFIGHATRDAELKYTKNNKPMTIIGMAINSGYGDNKQVSYVSILAFGKTAEFAAEQIKKGSLFLAEGELQVKNKEERSYVNVLANKVTFIRHALNREERPPERERQDTDNNEDIPF
jgi:single-strand DNA-binding protein